MMPKMVSTPMPRKIMTVTTLMSAIQYSVSPYTRTEAMLSRKIMHKNSRLQPQAGMKLRSGSQ